ncbi:MAG: TonB-dependent receptor [Pseudohongiellaceae bacterium]
MTRKLLVSAIAMATAFTAHQGAAQSNQEAVEEILVTAVSRRPEELADVNASISLLSEEELRLISATHYQEALNRLPGVNVNRNNGQESLMSIRSPVLTGAGACGSFLLAEEGIPLRSAGFCNVNEMFDAHTENASRIEVIRGPGSAFYGSNAVHGVVNVVLPEPGERVELSLETGPRGFLRANAGLGVESGNFKQLLLINTTNEEGWADDSGYDQQKGSWLYDYTTAGGFQLNGGVTFTNLNQETAGYVEGYRAYADDDLKDSNSNPEAYRDTQSTRVWTRISRELDSGWELMLTPYFREANMTFIQHFLPGAPVEDNEHRSLGLQFAAYRDLAGDATLALGLDAESTTGRLLQTQENPTQGSPFLVGTIPVGKHYDYEVDATQYAPFAQYQRFWENGWDITLGLRYESMEYDYDNQMIAGRTMENGVPCGFGGCRYNRPADRSDDFGNWSPKVGVRYQLTDEHNIQARMKKGFRAPQATELYRLQNEQSVADLDSVELDSYELALEGGGDNWRYALTGYLMDKQNEIINDSARVNLNDSDTRHRGLELSGSVDLTESLTLLGAYNIARHTYENDLESGGVAIEGNDVDTAPRRFGNFILQWRPLNDVVTELEWVNMGEYYSNPENLNEYEGHDLFNLRARWQINPSLNVALNIMNVTDEEYAERADWTTFGGDRYFVGEPVRAFLSVSWAMPN